MTTYKDLLEALSSLTEEQLNTEIQFTAEGCPDHDRNELLVGRGLPYFRYNKLY